MNDHEDLYRDGRNMPARGVAMIHQQRVVVGFRPQGQVSVYCGEDPVFQFNRHGQMRRVYYRGERYSAVGGRLVRLTRSGSEVESADSEDAEGIHVKPERAGSETHPRGRSTGRVQFVESPVEEHTRAEIQSVWQGWLDRLTAQTQWESVGLESSQWSERIQKWCRDVPREIEYADAPHA